MSYCGGERGGFGMRILWPSGCDGIFSVVVSIFCWVLGRNPPWEITLLGSGGVGGAMHVCSMHWLRELVISWNLCCASSHCVLVR